MEMSITPEARKFHMLSIDIGIKNLGFSVLNYDKLGKKTFSDFDILFDIFDISKHLKKRGDIVNSRCEALSEWMKCLLSSFGTFERVIIERQVNRNTMAMELMYAIVMMCQIMIPEAEIIIFDPKDKFLKLGLTYETKNKAHKKQSVRYAKRLIDTFYVDLSQTFGEFDKKDDVSDAINQAFVWLFHNGLLNYDLNEYLQIIGEAVSVDEQPAPTKRRMRKKVSSDDEATTDTD